MLTKRNSIATLIGKSSRPLVPILVLQNDHMKLFHRIELLVLILIITTILFPWALSYSELFKVDGYFDFTIGAATHSFTKVTI